MGSPFKPNELLKVVFTEQISMFSYNMEKGLRYKTQSLSSPRNEHHETKEHAHHHSHSRNLKDIYTLIEKATCPIL